MTNTRRLALTLVLALAVAPLAARQTTAGSDDVDVLLQAGLHREQVEGKVAEAIALYKQVIEKAGPSKRVLAARAQLQLARVYEKTGRPEAPEAYRTVLKEYLDQPTQVAAARESLARLAATSSQSGLTPRHHATEVYTIDAFSPDGQQMLIVTPDLADTQLLLKDRLTGHETVLATRTNEGRPLSGRMSPDGKWVSLGWLDYQPRTFGLRVVSVAGGAQKTLLPQQSVANLWNVGWSSDATAVLVYIGGPQRTDSGTLAWVTVADGTVRPIKTIEPWRTLPGPPLGRISLSPDGATIAFTARSAEGASDAYIYVVDANGQNERAIVTMAGRNVEAVWTPGSDRLVFVHVDSPTDRSLWTVRLPLGEGPEAPSLVQGNFSGALIDMTRAGELFYGKTVQGGQAEFIAQPTSGGYRVVQTFDGQSGVWSSADQLAFIRSGQTNRLIVRSMRSGEERGYAIDGLRNVSPRWLPGNASLIVTVGSEQGDQAFRRVDLTSGEITEMFAVFGDGYRRGAAGTVSPDGRTLYLACRVEAGGPWIGIDAVDTTTGASRRIVTFSPSLPGGSGGLGLAVSPDGRTLAIGAPSSGNDLADVQNRILTVGTDGSNLREIYGPFHGVASADRIHWTGDGQFVLFTAHSPNGLTTSGVARGVRIMRVPAAGGAAQPVGLDTTSLQGDAPLPRLLAGPLMGNFDINANDNRLVFSVGTRTTFEHWSLDNVLAVIGNR